MRFSFHGFYCFADRASKKFFLILKIQYMEASFTKRPLIKMWNYHSGVCCIERSTIRSKRISLSGWGRGRWWLMVDAWGKMKVVCKTLTCQPFYESNFLIFVFLSGWTNILLSFVVLKVNGFGIQFGLRDGSKGPKDVSSLSRDKMLSRASEKGRKFDVPTRH